MNRTRIDWTDFSVNPVKGLCPMDCKDASGKPYCYARRYYKRFHRPEQIVFDATWWEEIGSIPPGSKVFVGSTIELFGPWVKDEWRYDILRAIADNPQVTFILLTKRYEDLARCAVFPDNCWVGGSACNHSMFHDASYWLQQTEAPVRFYSFEPLLGRINVSEPNAYYMGDWVIIGPQTPLSRKTAPQYDWVKEIVAAADRAGAAVFLKEKLKPMFQAHVLEQHDALETGWAVREWVQCKYPILRHEFPAKEVRS